MEISSKHMYVNMIYYPVLSLGPGKRVGIWTQGCNIKCKGCISKHTWNKDKKYLMSIEKICKTVISYNSPNLTISGGEPFDQPKALLEFLKKIRNYFNDILIYSGYTYEYLKKNFSEILYYVDVLIDGPFKQNLPTNKIYKGSENQRIFLFNKSLIDKYIIFMTETKRNLQFIKYNNNIYVLGIPHINDSINVNLSLKVKNGKI
jgi:anaerobic ribonucleoside-triphosphate reductase activating protein